jgi:hypothetical protein
MRTLPPPTAITPATRSGRSSYFKLHEYDFAGSLGVRRIYNGNDWGVPAAKVASAIGRGEIPFVSWKLAHYTVSTVPQTAISSACTSMKSFAPLPIWATVYHESEDNLAASAQAAAYRALFRQVVHTCEKTGVQNVAWTQPTFMAPFSFGTASHRNPA